MEEYSNKIDRFLETHKSVITEWNNLIFEAKKNLFRTCCLKKEESCTVTNCYYFNSGECQYDIKLNEFNSFLNSIK